MRLALSVIGFFLAYVAATNIFDEDHASSPYDFHPYYFNRFYSPYRLAGDELRLAGDELRTLALGMGGGFTAAIPRPIVTNIRVMTAKFTCSVSVTNRCSARQALGKPPGELEQPSSAASTNSDRGEEEDDVLEQFSIAPSAVQDVEATQLPARESRAADPQWPLSAMSPRFNYLQEVRPAFHNGPYNPIAMPFNRRYAPVGQQRQFLPFITNMFTVTHMETSFVVKTVSFVPSCSVAGTLPQCPNGK